MQILKLKHEEEFAGSDIRDGEILTWPERGANGSIIMRYKDSNGNSGTIGGGAAFFGSIMNARLTRGFGGSGGPGTDVERLPAAEVAIQQSLVFYDQILKG